MNAIRVHGFGDADVLVYEDAPVPNPAGGQLLVKIEAAGVNFIDVYQRTGAYASPLPFIPGMEAAGKVVEVSPGVEGFDPGDRIAYAMEKGTYAEHAVVAASKAVLIPDAIDSQQAAAVMLQGMTAHYLSHSTYPLQEGDTALIHAASGGVGLLLVQMAKRRGARVIGTASTSEKVELALEFGADEVIRYTEVDFVEAVKRLTDGAGVDVVYDSVGRTTFMGGLDCLKPRGTMVLYGQSSGAVEPFDPQILNAKGSLFLTRPSLGHYIADRSELAWRATALFEWIASGELRVRIDRTLPLSEAAEAHRYIQGRKTRGKVLLIP